MVGSHETFYERTTGPWDEKRTWTKGISAARFYTVTLNVLISVTRVITLSQSSHRSKTSRHVNPRLETDAGRSPRQLREVLVDLRSMPRALRRHDKTQHLMVRSEKDKHGRATDSQIVIK